MLNIHCFREGKMKTGGWEAVGGDNNQDMEVDSDPDEESNTRKSRLKDR